MLLRQRLLESELLHHQLQYDKVFRVQQVSSETEKKAMNIILDGILFEIEDIRRELKLIENNK